MEGFAGVTAIELRVGAAALTVRVVVPVIAPDEAWIVDEPIATLVARPELEIVATDGFKELHVTEFVMLCVLASVKVPVAVNCCVAFLASVGLAGVTAIDFNVAAATVRVMEPTTLPEAAVMSVLPVDFAVTIPLLLIAATLGFWEFHTTLAEMSGVDPSEKCPTAVNCCEVPIVRAALTGETSMEVNRD